MKIPSKKFTVGNLTFDLSGGRMVMLITAILIVLAMVLIYFTLLRPTPGLDGAQVKPPPLIKNATVGGSGTPEYNQAVEQQNSLVINKAAQSGKTAIATPVDLNDKKVNLNLLNLNDQAPKPAPVASAPTAQPQVVMPKIDALLQPDFKDAAVQAEMDNVIKRVGLLEQGATTQSLDPYTPSKIVLAQAARMEQASLSSPTSSSANGSPTAAASSGGPSALIKRLLKPGNILYAQFTTRLTSTLPSPAVGEIEQGPLAGYKILGSWSKAPNVDAMTIQFSRLVLPDGTTVAFKGYAIDPNTTLTAVESNVDYKVLSRTANFLGATFLAVLNGYSQAYASTGQQVVQSTTGTVVTTPAFSARQAAALGLTQATTALQPLEGLMMQKVMQPNVINVDPGTPFGLLVISN